MNANHRLQALEAGRRQRRGFLVAYTHDGATFATTSNGHAVMTQADVVAAARGRRVIVVSYVARSLSDAIPSVEEP